jgi:hypothetical protein
MPHFPKPFFRTARQAWFVQLGRKQVNLGPDRDEAFKRYRSTRNTRKPSVSSPPVGRMA